MLGVHEMDAFTRSETQAAASNLAGIGSLGPLALCRYALEKIDDEAAFPPEIGARLAEVVTMLEEHAASRPGQ